MGDEPLFHDHAATRAETLTGPLARNFGGGQLVGDFTVGSKELLTQSTGYGPSGDGKVNPLEHAVSQTDALTYPLWGQNVLDWRNPKKTHNNVPPCLNIYARYWQQTQREPNLRMASCEDMLQRMAEIRGVYQSSLLAEGGSAAEAKYDSTMVCELEKYGQENLTKRDCILRMALDCDEQVRIMRQSLQMLLDIFATKTNDELSTSNGTMQELLMRHLDNILMPVDEFMQWYIKKSKQLDEISKKIELAKELAVSVPPLNHIGRIIVSYTDDTEQKVIAHYGGKSWRRIENFLRGVNEDDANNILGRKWGEDYVALRESNVPVHAHSETITNVDVTRGQDWAAKEKSGNTKLVNTPQGESDCKSIGVKNTTFDYQISPLEYASKGANDITLPHDNLPPYLKVYIWECTALTDEERKVTGEPDDGLCVVTWLGNGGTSQESTKWKCQIGEHVKYNPDDVQQPRTAPTFTRSEFQFDGWLCPDGTIKPSTSSNPDIHPVIDDVAMGNAYYVAQWKRNKYTVTFDSNGGTPETMSRTYDEGQDIGYFPTVDTMPDDAESLIGWFTAKTGGDVVDADTKVTESTTYYAHWKKKQVEKCTVKFYNGNTLVETMQVVKGNAIGQLAAAPDAPTGHTFTGWYTKVEGGTKVNETKIVENDLNLYAQWKASVYVITWQPMNGESEFTWEREHESEIGSLPTVSRDGYDQDGWWTEEEGGE